MGRFPQTYGLPCAHMCGGMEKKSGVIGEVGACLARVCVGGVLWCVVW